MSLGLKYVLISFCIQIFSAQASAVNRILMLENLVIDFIWNFFLFILHQKKLLHYYIQIFYAFKEIFYQKMEQKISIQTQFKSILGSFIWCTSLT